jgi:hypothetical protein
MVTSTSPEHRDDPPVPRPHELVQNLEPRLAILHLGIERNVELLRVHRSVAASAMTAATYWSRAARMLAR